MHRQVLQLDENHQTEQQAEETKEDADKQQPVSVDPTKNHVRQIRQLERGFTAMALSKSGRRGYTKSNSCK
jgi:hypothetical protein